MAQEEAFLRAVLAKPNDDLPRLIFADWLDEQDQSARAEFIRVQCELTRLVDHVPEGMRLPRQLFPLILREYIPTDQALRFDWLIQRERRLLENADAWIGALPQHAAVNWRSNYISLEYHFERGFASSVEFSGHSTFRSHATRVFRAAPIRHLLMQQLTTRTAILLAYSKHLVHLKTLTVRSARIGTAGALTLAESPYLENLKSFRLHAVQSTAEEQAHLIGPRGRDALLARFGDRLHISF